jgi:hypothetical protein
MVDTERRQLLVAMGASIGAVAQALEQKDHATAAMYFVKFMGGVGFLAQEIDDLYNATGN